MRGACLWSVSDEPHAACKRRPPGEPQSAHPTSSGPSATRTINANARFWCLIGFFERNFFLQRLELFLSLLFSRLYGVVVDLLQILSTFSSAPPAPLSTCPSHALQVVVLACEIGACLSAHLVWIRMQHLQGRYISSYLKPR